MRRISMRVRMISKGEKERKKANVVDIVVVVVHKWFVFDII